MKQSDNAAGAAWAVGFKSVEELALRELHSRGAQLDLWFLMGDDGTAAGDLDALLTFFLAVSRRAGRRVATS